MNPASLSLNSVRKCNEYRKKCRETNLFPISLALNDRRILRGGRLDLIAPNYETYNEWVVGLRWLLNNRTSLRQYAE